MNVFYGTKDGVIGFGETAELIDEDLYINLCRLDLSNDSKGLYIKRREQLMPWNPKPNLLHVNGLGCIVYDGVRLLNTKTGKSIEVSQSISNVFYYMAVLFGTDINYEDIVIVMQREIDILFKVAAPNIVSIEDMPVIRVADSILGFKPTIVYTFEGGIIIGVNENTIGVKRKGSDMFYVIDRNDEVNYLVSCSYIGYRVGVVITNERIEFND